MEVDLSIIIVTFNLVDITLQVLRAYQEALAADPFHRYEIIVVDNASQDGVVEAVAENYPEVQLIRLPDNVGFAKGNNIGFSSSRGRYLLFSNPDIEITPETLPTLMTLMDQNPQVGACTPFLKLVKTGEIDWGAHRGFPTPWAAFTYFSGLSKLFRRSKKLAPVFCKYHLMDRDLTKEHEVDVIRGGFFLVRRDVFEQAGRWDEDYFMFGEDIDLCYQIKRLDYKIMFYPQTSALHYHGATTGLKRSSQDLATVDFETKKRVYNAFYDAMKLFYDKNYKTKYGRITRWFVLLGINLKRNLGRRRGTV